MRKRERIQPFMEKIGKLWEENVPDWRFGQLIVNVLGSFDIDPWFLEEDDMLVRFEKYFEKEKEGVKIQNEEERREDSRDSAS